MTRRRFVAPAREAVSPAVFDHPAFAPYAVHLDLLRGAAWPSLGALNELLAGALHPRTGAPLAFVPQTQALLSDGLHYEQRIHDRGEIATRERNWHDLLNALAWIVFGSIKAAMNVRQVEDLAAAGPARRTRSQYALTQFDEAGAIVSMRDASLLAAWDRHDWTQLFEHGRAAWLGRETRVVVVGHALLEHLLAGRDDLVAKALVVTGPAPSSLARVAAAIASGAALDDPQSSRPLPLCGIPGWHPGNDAPGFQAAQACFSPARSGAGIRPRGVPIAT